MWDSFKSLRLSIIVTRLFIAAIILLIFFLPYLAKIYLDAREISHGFLYNFIMPFYACIIPAGIALFCLDRLLARIKKDEVFVQSNIQAIRIISWCCFAISLITGGAAYFYPPYIFVTMIMFFCGVIVRVIKNVFTKAVFIKNENDYTI